MRKVSQVELKRLKKKGKVRKKMGAQPEKRTMPAPVAKDGEGMSGSTLSDKQPVQAPSTPKVEKAATQPIASMSASMELRDGLLKDLISNNTRVIEEFRLALKEQKSRQGTGYRHRINRNSKTSLIEEVISTPMETEQ